MIRHRWLEVARRHHPDVGGVAARFRQAKQAYEVLRDPDRRAEYERFWMRALGPFERVVPAGPALEAPAPAGASVSLDGNGAARLPPEAAVPVPAPLSGAFGEALAEAGRLFAARADLDRRISAVADPGGPGLAALLARLEGALAPIPLEELRRLSDGVAHAVTRLEELRGQLAGLAALRRRLEA
jgi:curved DNA-binding protein CbpA